jgi:hypothetical protein
MGELAQQLRGGGSVEGKPLQFAGGYAVAAGSARLSRLLLLLLLCRFAACRAGIGKHWGMGGGWAAMLATTLVLLLLLLAGQDLDEDIVVCSARAYLTALNKMIGWVNAINRKRGSSGSSMASSSAGSSMASREDGKEEESQEKKHMAVR